MNRKDDKTRMTVRIDSKVNQELERRAEQLGVSKSAYINMVLSTKVNNIEF